MRRRWIVRIALPVAIAGAFAGIVLATGRDLNGGYLVAATLAVAALLWLLLDLAPSVPYTSWEVNAVYTPRQPGSDARLERLSERLSSGVDRDAVAYDVHRALSDVVDDRLRRNHGVDRSRDPDAAARVLGPDLTEYLTSKPHLRRSGRSQELSHLLNRIEEL